MANPHKGEVDLKVGDTDYTLRLSINEIVQLQQLTGLKVMALSAALGDPDVDIAMWRSALWASLQCHHKGITLDGAGDLMAEAGLPLILEKVGEALTAAFPSGAGGEKANPQKASPTGTGTS